MSRPLLPAALLGSLVAATAARAADPAPPAARVAELVRRLADDDFDRREAAEADLARIGPAVLPAVAALGPPDDPEVAYRLGRLKRTVLGVAEDLRPVLEAHLPHLHDPDVRRDLEPEVLALIVGHQPAAGDYLVAAAVDPKHPLRRAAANAVARSWDLLSAEQAGRYLAAAVRVEVAGRPTYPRGVAAMIAVRFRVGEGAGGCPAGPGFELTTVTTHALDGRPHGKPYRAAYTAGTCTTAWVRTGGLAEGRHTLAAGLTFEGTHRGTALAGKAPAAEHAFSVVGADAPDDLAFRPDAAAEARVRAALWVAETDEGKDAADGPVPPGAVPAVDWWRPQYTWAGADGEPNGVHVPAWRLEKPLPFDLAFDVCLRVEGSGDEYPADALVVLKGTTSNMGRVWVTDPKALAEGRSGFVPVRIVLRPSRAMALTNPAVARYYAGEVTTGVLRVKVGP